MNTLYIAGRFDSLGWNNNFHMLMRHLIGQNEPVNMYRCISSYIIFYLFFEENAEPDCGCNCTGLTD